MPQPIPSPDAPPFPQQPRRFRPLGAILALVALLLAPVALARFEWRDVIQEITLAPDGGVIVADTRTLWTDEDFGEAFICVLLEPAQTLTLLEGSGPVGPGPAARALSQPCEDGSRASCTGSTARWIPTATSSSGSGTSSGPTTR